MEDIAQPKLEIGYGTAKEEDSFASGEKAASRALSMIHINPIAAVIVFASVHHDLRNVLRGIRNIIPDVPLFGCTTAGEICNEPLHESVVVTLLASSYMRVSCGLGRDVSRDWRISLEEAVNTPDIQPYFNDINYWQQLTLNGKSAFAVLFSPGNTRHNTSRSFNILESIKMKSLGRLPVFGGSAADDWRMETNFVLLDDEVFPDSLILSVFETQLQFGIAMDHGFVPTNHQTIVTCSEDHEVLELDGCPAADFFARLFGSTRAELEGKHLTFTTGYTLGSSDPMGQYSINVASYFTSRGGINLTQSVAAGTVLTLMAPDSENMLLAGENAFRKAILRGGISDPALTLVAYCAMIPRIAGDQSREGIRIMAEKNVGSPLVGFWSFGEQGLADDGTIRHNNAVISTLVLGKDLSPIANVAIENDKLREYQMQQTRTLEKINRELLTEINERKRAETKVNEQLHFLQQLLDSIPIPVYYKDVDGLYLGCNAAFEASARLSRKDIVGKTVHEVVPKERADMHHEMDLALLRHPGLQTFEVSGIYKDGKHHDVIFNKATFVDANDCVAGIVGIQTDITELKKAEEERKMLEAQLHQSQKMEAVGQLAGGIAHDFNNILTAIMGYSSMILMRMDKESPLLHYVEQVLKSAERAVELTKGLLAFSRRQVLHAEPTDLCEIVRGLENMLGRLVPKDIDFRTTVAEGDLIVMADKVQIEQVIMNLVTNAKDAMPRGGTLTIEVSPAVMEEQFVHAHGFGEPGDYACLNVLDTGHGMDEETRKKIFEPFFTTKEVGKGTGLGMAIIYGIIRQHNGYISVYSEKGRGTTFRIYLPLIEEGIKEEQGALEVEPPPGGTETILLAEDDEAVRELHRTILEEAGYRVIEAVDGRDALDKFEEHMAEVDILATDVIMPKMNGKSLYEEIRKIRSDMKVLFMSGYTKDIIVERGIIEDEFILVTKPVTSYKLLKKIREILDWNRPK